jgi:hypothetical protein
VRTTNARCLSSAINGINEVEIAVPLIPFSMVDRLPNK